VLLVEAVMLVVGVKVAGGVTEGVREVATVLDAVGVLLRGLVVTVIVLELETEDDGVLEAGTD